MLQNRQQQGSRAGTTLQVLPDARENDAQVDTLKIVACSICRAVYVPAGAEAVRNSLPALETAFLAVCRSCFRCQRPACPQCWNPVHHVCAACGEEARLPFCSPVPSLEGLVFLPPSAVHADQAGRFSFTCQRNGRFYIPEEPAPLRAESAEVAPLPTSAVDEAVIADALSALPAPKLDSTPSLPSFSAAPSVAYPSWLQEVLGRDGTASAVSSPREEQPAANWSQESRASWSPVYPPPQMVPALPAFVLPTAQAPAALPVPQQQAINAIPVQPAPALAPQSQVVTSSASAAESKSSTQVQEEEEFSVFERIENVLIVITSILLLAVVLMIVLSISFTPVNTFFLTYLHIDIRTEIAYLLQLK